MRILLVDDEAELTDPLSRVLSQEGYEVNVATNGQTGKELALQHNYDLLILDWMLPGKSGLEICQELRDRQLSTAVLFLTAKDTVDDRVAGLDAGGDDYLVKPFELRELLARVRALLRRPPTLAPTEGERLQVADLELDRENQLAYRQGKTIKLSDKEIELLAYLMTHPHRLLTREEIYGHLWPDSSKDKPQSNVLAALIRLLRRKIEAQGTKPLIHTVYGKGYRFGQSDN